MRSRFRERGREIRRGAAKSPYAGLKSASSCCWRRRAAVRPVLPGSARLRAGSWRAGWARGSTSAEPAPRPGSGRRVRGPATHPRRAPRPLPVAERAMNPAGEAGPVRADRARAGARPRGPCDGVEGHRRRAYLQRACTCRDRLRRTHQRVRRVVSPMPEHFTRSRRAAA